MGDLWSTSVLWPLGAMAAIAAVALVTALVLARREQLFKDAVGGKGPRHRRDQ